MSFERASRQPLMLGLFMPHQQGAWSPSSAPRGTSWTFDYNAKCAVMADALGFDLVFALAQWMGKGGYGGKGSCGMADAEATDAPAGNAGEGGETKLCWWQCTVKGGREVCVISARYCYYSFHSGQLAG